MSQLAPEQARLFEWASLTNNNGDPQSVPKVAVLVCFMGYGAGCTSNEPTSHIVPPVSGRG